MSVDRNEKIWAESNTGTRMHAFVQSGTDGNLRAMCRSTIERSTGARYVGKDEAFLICSRCVKLAVAMWNRAEASMEQADPYSDGFHTVDETTADANRETEKKPVAISADMNRELLRQARAVAEAHKRLFPSDIDATHAEALEMDAAGEALTAAHRDAMTLLEPEEKPKRWHYECHVVNTDNRFLAKYRGYMTDTQAIRVERRVRDIYGTPSGRHLTNFVIRPAK